MIDYYVIHISVYILCILDNGLTLICFSLCTLKCILCTKKWLALTICATLQSLSSLLLILIVRFIYKWTHSLTHFKHTLSTFWACAKLRFTSASKLLGHVSFFHTIIVFWSRNIQTGVYHFWNRFNFCSKLLFDTM